MAQASPLFIKKIDASLFLAFLAQLERTGQPLDLVPFFEAGRPQNEQLLKFLRVELGLERGLSLIPIPEGWDNQAAQDLSAKIVELNLSSEEVLEALEIMKGSLDGKIVIIGR